MEILKIGVYGKLLADLRPVIVSVAAVVCAHSIGDAVVKVLFCQRFVGIFTVQQLFQMISLAVVFLSFKLRKVGSVVNIVPVALVAGYLIAALGEIFFEHREQVGSYRIYHKRRTVCLRKPLHLPQHLGIIAAARREREIYAAVK